MYGLIPGGRMFRFKGLAYCCIHSFISKCHLQGPQPETRVLTEPEAMCAFQSLLNIECFGTGECI